jgi:hypothetical protein
MMWCGEAGDTCSFYTSGRWEPGNRGIGIGRRWWSFIAASNHYSKSGFIRLLKPINLSSKPTKVL